MRSVTSERTTSERLAAMLSTVLLVLIAAGRSPASAAAPPVRIKEITTIAGEFENKLTGQGLVVGLAGTGGSSPTTKFNALNMMQQLGLRASPLDREQVQRSQEKTNNMSTVIVTANLPPHVRAGQKLDIYVSAYDDAKSLAGGTLVQTTLTGVDGVVYAIAQGAISIDGGNFGGEAATVVKNHPTSGHIAGGAMVVAETPTEIFRNGGFELLLNMPHYETAVRIAREVNALCQNCATVANPATVFVRFPAEYVSTPYEFIALVQELTVVPDAVAVVVINEKTGTVIIGDDVRISRVAITHGNLYVRTVENPQVSQPNPLSNGETTVVPQTNVDVTEQSGNITVLEESATVGDLATSLNALGATPRDLSAILQMLRKAGALHAEVILN
ncbi:MAG: flagellar basal body P-ring protein FlgI [Planctomycetaceae bacterium]|nr:flagellar basal body P-ring protein FlgI [Planctomycetaceae bacterium]